jgi:catechol 2,3-dioxygenase-like lactoylglutathione lyase family enzyme
MKRIMELLTAVAICFIARGLPAEEKPLATRVDHFYVESEKAQPLFAFFKETFQLAESWPFRDAGTHASGGLWLGNTIWEFVTFPDKGDKPVKTELRGIAFEPSGGADETAAELNRRGVSHAEVENRTRQSPDGQMRVAWSLLDLKDFPPAEANIFFVDYKNRKFTAARNKARDEEFAARHRGPLGIIGVAEITVGVQDIDEARGKWSALFAPSPRISEDTFVFESGPQIRLVRAESPGILGIVLTVRSLAAAETFLKERKLLVKDVGQIAIAPGAVEGLSIRIIDADSSRSPAHPLLGPGQGTGHGVDHVGMAIRDFKKTKDDFEQVLGFKVRENPPQPNGWPQSIIWFENATYLEFQPIAALPWIATMFDYNDGYADFAKKHEGAVFQGLVTSSAKYASDHLKARNFQADLVEDDPFHYVHISHEPSGEARAFPLAIFFIEYAFDLGRPARLAARLEQGMMTHPNTARRLYSVWFAVRDLEAGLRNVQDAGFEPGEPREAKFLGAKGREVKAGDGCLLLLQPADKNGELNKFLSDRHDGEIIGLSIEVADVEKARSLIESRSGKKLEPYDGFYGRSIMIPPDMTHGVWLELFQR